MKLNENFFKFIKFSIQFQDRCRNSKKKIIKYNLEWKLKIIFVAIFWRILSKKLRILTLTNYIRIIYFNEIWYFIKSA